MRQAHADSSAPQTKETGKHHYGAAFHFAAYDLHGVEIIHEMIPAMEPVAAKTGILFRPVGENGIDAAGGSNMIRDSQLSGRLDRSFHDFVMSYGRIFNRSIKRSGALKTAGTVEDNQISLMNVITDAKESFCAAARQFFQGDGGGRTAHAGAGTGNRHSFVNAGIGYVFPIISHKMGFIPQRGDFFYPVRIAGQQNIRCYIC